MGEYETETLTSEEVDTTSAYEAATGSEEYERYEDDPKNVQTTPEGFEPAEVGSVEVPLEESRKDETTLLATDRVSIGEDGELIIEKQQ